MTHGWSSRLLGRLIAYGAWLACGSAFAQAACTPGEYTDTVDGVELVYQIPPSFNGTLLVYAQGYADDSHGGQYTQTPVFLGNAALRQALLDAGYLLAAAQYSLPDADACQGNGNYCQGRWAVPLGVTSSAAIPARIAALQPDCDIQRRLIAGADMGGLVALQIAESPTHAAAFDGALAMCTPGMGLSRWVDSLIDFSILKQAATLPDYPGTVAANAVPWPFDFEADGVRSQMILQLQTPSAFRKLEFQRLTSRLPNTGNEYYLLPSPVIPDVVQLATELIADLQDQVGAPFGPLETLNGQSSGYSLDAAQIAYFISLGGEDAFETLIEYLDAANALPAQLSASQTARNALHALGEVTGDVRIPALMVQNKADAVTPDWGLTQYREVVAASGRSAHFHGTFASGTRHCRFDAMQVLTALDALGDWTASGIAPTVATFPAPGFDAGYVPANAPRPRVNVWLADVSVTPGAGVQHVEATVVRSNTSSALSLAYAASGGYETTGTLAFPAGGEQRAIIALEVPDARDQAVTLELVQTAGPANVITPQRLVLPAPDAIFDDGFE